MMAEIVVTCFWSNLPDRGSTEKEYNEEGEGSMSGIKNLQDSE
jgi:hypothetical protein